MTLIPWLLLILVLVLQLVTLPVLDKRHNSEGASWQAAIPLWHFVVWLRLIQRPWYWIFFLLVPGINLILMTVMHVELGLAFGKRSVKDQWIMGALPWWGLWELRQGHDVWVGKRDWSKTRKSTVREWSEALIWATVVAGTLRLMTFEPFTIPTPSMEGSMLVGDYLLVDKMAYGVRLPQTPFSLPFVHNALPGSLVPSYTEWFSLPYMRLPGWRDVERNDAVVFNFPHGDTVIVTPQYVGHDYYRILREQAITQAIKQSGSIDEYLKSPSRYLNPTRNALMKNPGLRARPLDKMENYVKRCVAIAGDEIKSRDGQLYINGSPADNPEHLQFEYTTVFKSDVPWATIQKEFGFTKQDFEMVQNVGKSMIAEVNPTPGYPAKMWLTNSEVERLKVYCTSIEKKSGQAAHFGPNGQLLQMFPNVWFDEFNAWDPDNFGPIVLPKEGATVELTERNRHLYRRWITVYEGHTMEESTDGTVRIDGRETSTYTFGMDGYWMMGDNRHRSADSRYWGFVPENHIVGMARFIWFSKQSEADHGESKIRWDRMMQSVE